MSDVIKRKQVYDVLDVVRFASDNEKKYAFSLMERIPSASSVEPERKKGKWIDYSEDGYVECPFCHSATNCECNKEELHYCFSCGVELEG